MNTEFWMVWDTEIGWCGQNITSEFWSHHATRLGWNGGKQRWWPEIWSFEGKEKTVVIISDDDGLGEDEALDFLDMIVNARYRRVYADLKPL